MNHFRSYPLPVVFRKALFIIVVVIASAYSVFAQEIIKQDGLTFYLLPDLRIEKKDKIDVNPAKADWYELWFTIRNIDVLRRSEGIDYLGKNYGYNDFGGQLQQYFNAIQVTAVSMTVTLSGFKDPDCAIFSSAAWKSGTFVNKYCTPLTPDTRINVTGYKISSLHTGGVLALQSKIRELEAEKKKEEAAKEKVTALINEGNDFYFEGEYEAAIRKFNEALKLDPDNNEAAVQKDYAETRLVNEKKEAEEKNKTMTVEQKKFDSTQSKIEKSLQKSKIIPDSKIKSQIVFHREKWVRDSVFREEQWKKEKQFKEEKRKRDNEFLDRYEQYVYDQLGKSKQLFNSYSPEKQKKICEEAAGYAANADLMAEAGEEAKAADYYQKAAFSCPTHPHAEKWASFSVTEVSFTLTKAEQHEEKQKMQKMQLQNLQFMESVSAFSNQGMTNLYNKYLIEQTYTRFYDNAKAATDRYSNMFSKIGNIDMKFSDPSSLFNFIDSRVTMVDANWAKANNAAAAKASAEYNKTYAGTGSMKTATGTAAVTGMADVLANAILANGAKKELEKERKMQLDEIFNEYTRELNASMNDALRRMLIAKTEAEDKQACSDYLYRAVLLASACHNFNYNNAQWFYYRTYDQQQGETLLGSLKYIEPNDPDIREAERKMYFRDLAAKKENRPAFSGDCGFYTNTINDYSYRFYDEAKAYLGKALKRNPQSANAYYLLARLADPVYGDVERLKYMFLAAKNATPAQTHLNGYMQQTKAQFTNLLNDAFINNKPDKFLELVNEQLHSQILGTEFNSYVQRIIREDKQDFMNILLANDGLMRDKEKLKTLALTALQQNKRMVFQSLRKYITANEKIELNGVLLSLTEIAVLSDKHYTFSAMVNPAADFNRLAAELNINSDEVLKKKFYHCIAETAIWNDSPQLLDFISKNNPSYLSENTKLVDEAVTYKNKTKVLKWFSANGFADKKKLGQLLFSANTYHDLRLLLEAGADPNSLNATGGETVLSSILKKMESDLIIARQENNTINTFLKPAFSNDWNNRLALLFQYGADPLFLVPKQKEAAAIKNNYQSDIDNIYSYILKPGETKEQNSSPNSILFMYSALINDVQLTKRLLLAAKEKIAKGEASQQQLLNALNSKNGNGETALQLAVERKNFAVATLLFNAGADASAKTSNGNTISKLAKENGIELQKIEDLSDEKIFQFLIAEELGIEASLNKRLTTGLDNFLYSATPGISLTAQDNETRENFLNTKFPGYQNFMQSTWPSSSTMVQMVKEIILSGKVKPEFGFWLPRQVSEITGVKLKSTTSDKLVFTVELTSPERGLTVFTGDLNVPYYLLDGKFVFSLYTPPGFYYKTKVEKKVLPDQPAILVKPGRLTENNEVNYLIFSKPHVSSKVWDGSFIKSKAKAKLPYDVYSHYVIATTKRKEGTIIKIQWD